MSDPKMLHNSLSDDKVVPHSLDDADFTAFRCDPEGHLYDPRVRELLTSSGRKVEPSSEALAAVRMLGKKMRAMMERWAEKHGLSEGRFQILVRLQHQPDGRVTMGELAEMLDVSPRTVTGLVDHLERDGFARRVADPNDRRSIYAEMTDKGREAVQALWRDAAAGQQTLTRGVSESELIELRHICLKLITTMSAEEGKSHATN